MKTAVIFGGTGFIGSHLALYLVAHNLYDRIILADIKPIRKDFKFDTSRVEYIHVDVRKPIDEWTLPRDGISLIANFAAIHREPGHQPHEYFETNIPGAQNVCEWAELVSCNQIIFTSSIAPYGPSESLKNENTVPTPQTPYGESKLAAEKIHKAWQKTDRERRLIIVRPGVVFGPGEGGNVTRLIQATMRNYFFYMGNKNTRKAGGYVKELIRSMLWAFERIPNGGCYLYNFTLPTAPTIQDYVNTACKVKGVWRFVPNMPFMILLPLSYLIDWVTKPLGINQPISPVRVKKLRRSNNIEPMVLQRDGYQYHYTFEAAMQDWLKDRPDEWE